MSVSFHQSTRVDVRLSWVVFIFLFYFWAVTATVAVDLAVGGVGPLSRSPVILPFHLFEPKAPVSDISVNKLVCLTKPAVCFGSSPTRHTWPPVVRMVDVWGGGHSAHALH